MGVRRSNRTKKPPPLYSYPYEGKKDCCSPCARARTRGVYSLRHCDMALIYTHIYLKVVVVIGTYAPHTDRRSRVAAASQNRTTSCEAFSLVLTAPHTPCRTVEKALQYQYLTHHTPFSQRLKTRFDSHGPLDMFPANGWSEGANRLYGGHKPNANPTT